MWQTQVEMDKEVKISGKVVKGFQRGSKQLGVPTANIEMTPENVQITKDLVPGVYAAVGKLTMVDGCQEPADFDSEVEYPCALSIGWNPVYENDQKTVEAFLIHDFSGEEFYGHHLSVSLKCYVRAEALFANFDALILAIQCDIEASLNNVMKTKNQIKMGSS